MKRRTFFGTIGAASAASAASKPGTDMGEDYYDKLGVTKIINAAGTYTALTASIMPPPVQAAVARAAKSPVRLADLQKSGWRVYREEAEMRGGDGDRGSRFGADTRDGGLHHRCE